MTLFNSFFNLKRKRSLTAWQIYTRGSPWQNRTKTALSIKLNLFIHVHIIISLRTASLNSWAVHISLSFIPQLLVLSINNKNKIVIVDLLSSITVLVIVFTDRITSHITGLHDYSEKVDRSLASNQWDPGRVRMHSAAGIGQIWLVKFAKCWKLWAPKMKVKVFKNVEWRREMALNICTMPQEMDTSVVNHLCFMVFFALCYSSKSSSS